MKTLITLVVSLTLLLVASASAQVVSGPVYNPANGHSYYLGAQVNWTNAQLFASSLGGYLVTIDNVAENQWVANNFGSYGELWLGLTDYQHEGTFVWLNGETAVYRNWNYGEPNNGGYYYPDEDAVSMPGPLNGFPSGTWNDTSTFFKFFPVVEVVPEPSSLALLGFGAVALLFRARRN